MSTEAEETAVISRGDFYESPSGTATLKVMGDDGDGFWSVEFVDHSSGRLHEKPVGEDFLRSCTRVDKPRVAWPKGQKAVRGPIGTEIATEAPQGTETAILVPESVSAHTPAFQAHTAHLAASFDRYGMVVPEDTTQEAAIEMIARLDAVGKGWQMAVGCLMDFLVRKFPTDSRQRLRERLAEADPDGAELSIDTYSNYMSIYRAIGRPMQQEFPSVGFGVWSALASRDLGEPGTKAADKRRRELARRASDEGWTRERARHEVKMESGRAAVRADKEGATRHTPQAYDEAEAAARLESLRAEDTLVEFRATSFDPQTVIAAIHERRWDIEECRLLLELLGQYVREWDEAIQGQKNTVVLQQPGEVAGRDKDGLVSDESVAKFSGLIGAMADAGVGSEGEDGLDDPFADDDPFRGA